MELNVKLTEKELDLILTLNKNNGLNKSFLLKNIWNYNSDLDSHAFETHLHRLRKKMNNVFKDKNFIIEKNSLYYLVQINFFQVLLQFFELFVQQAFEPSI